MMNKQKANNKQLSKIATSYVPLYFVINNRIEEKKDISLLDKACELYNIEISPKAQDLIQSIQDYASKGFLTYYSFDLHSKYKNYSKWLSDMFSRLGDFFSALTGYKKKEKAQKAYNSLLSSMKDIYDIYTTEHETLLKGIQKNIDEINKVKPILKDSILIKLSEKLNSMGIKSTISDYPMESIDFRAFALNSEYDLISQNKLKIEESASDLFDYIIPLPYLAIRNFKKAKELNEKMANLNKEKKLITQKIEADLLRLEKLNLALNNIARIFKEIKETFVPFLEEAINDISLKYNNDYNQIPGEVLLAIKTSSKVLKEIADKKILKENFSVVNVAHVVKYSNKMSMNYNELKESILNIA